MKTKSKIVLAKQEYCKEKKFLKLALKKCDITDKSYLSMIEETKIKLIHKYNLEYSHLNVI